MLTPLARQAEKTKKYRELYEKLRHDEINLYIYKHDNAESARASINAVIEGINSRLEEGRAYIERLRDQYNEDRNSIAESDKLLQDLNDRILKFTVELQQKKGTSRSSANESPFSENRKTARKNPSPQAKSAWRRSQTS